METLLDAFGTNPNRNSVEPVSVISSKFTQDQLWADAEANNIAYMSRKGGKTSKADIITSSYAVDANTPAISLPVLKRNSPAWKRAVAEMQSPNCNISVRVNSEGDAEALLKEARGDVDRIGDNNDPYGNSVAHKPNVGYEVHPEESGTKNAPWNNLPHIKWHDWSKGKKNGGKGHIFFGP